MGETYLSDPCCGNCHNWGLMKNEYHMQIVEMEPKRICSVTGALVAPDFAGPKCTEWKRNWNLELEVKDETVPDVTAN